MWGVDEDDAFVPMTFTDPSSVGLFEADTLPDSACDFPFQTRIPGPRATTGRPASSQLDPQALMDENNALRQTKQSMRAAYSERLRHNERLKRQLEECRARFMSAFRSGINSQHS
jgi:hypothetical protein